MYLISSRNVRLFEVLIKKDLPSGSHQEIDLPTLRTPNSDSSFMSDLDELASNNCKEMVVMGDFNSNLLSPNSLTRKLNALMQDHQFHQSINLNALLLDLIDLCFSSAISSAGSDHLMIYITIPSNANTKSSHGTLLQKMRPSETG